MKTRMAIARTMTAAVALLCLAVFARAEAQDDGIDPLPSWRSTEARERITDFVEQATTEGGAGFVPADERIAVFDNDGTLWAERPVYFQLLFALDRAREEIASNPELKETSPYREIAANDLEALAAGGEEALLDLVMRTHAGQTEREFADEVRSWLAQARHPERGLPYTSLVYQPMLELLAFLRDHGFDVWIVSGGGQSFLRAWAEDIYGIPPERVIGSQLDLTYQTGADPALLRNSEISHINDKGGKPVGIQRFIGRRPILAVGNSDGDFAMLEWTTSSSEPSLGVLLHHTDAEREWAYDRESHVGRLDRGLDHAGPAGWVVIDMAEDWRRVFPGDPQP